MHGTLLAWARGQAEDAPGAVVGDDAARGVEGDAEGGHAGEGAGLVTYAAKGEGGGEGGELAGTAEGDGGGGGEGVWALQGGGGEGDGGEGA